MQSRSKHSTLVKAQLNEVRFFQWFSLGVLFSNFRSFLDMLLEPSVAFKVVDGSAKPTTSEVPTTEAKDANSSDQTSPGPLASEESVSEFIAQVASLVK